MSKHLRITFVLPGSSHVPVGGVKVVYEYANHLSRKGHDITVVHLARSCHDKGLRGDVASMLRYLYRRNSFKPTSWFPVDPSVRLLWVRSPSEHHIPDGDTIVATAWPTAEWIASYPESKGQRFYLIQHLETWTGSEERVTATWKLPLTKVVIARWLEDIATRLGEPSVYIPNGLDFSRFMMRTPPEDRVPGRIMMLYHDLDWKGSADGLKALSIVRGHAPDIKPVLFGVPARPRQLPDWIEYIQCPSQERLRDLYNEASIFVAPSWAEGWPLPPAEALMSGAALVATDIGGHREYAMHETTALLSPIKDPEALAANILRFLRDKNLRVRLAARGNKFVQQFTWERAGNAMESLIQSDSSDPHAASTAIVCSDRVEG